MSKPLFENEKNWIIVNLSNVLAAPWNYKTDSEEMESKLKANIDRNGQIENLIVRELGEGRYEAVNGNHRRKVMIGLGKKEAVVYNLGVVSEAEAFRIATDTNETRFQTDNIKLAELLHKTSQAFTIDEMAKTSPFSIEQINNHIKLLSFDFDALKKNPDDVQQPPTEKDYFRTVVLRLPESITVLFLEQIARFKKALHPDAENIEEVSPVQAIEAMTQHLAQIPDNQLIG